MVGYKNGKTLLKTEINMIMTPLHQSRELIVECKPQGEHGRSQREETLMLRTAGSNICKKNKQIILLRINNTTAMAYINHGS